MLNQQKFEQERSLRALATGKLYLLLVVTGTYTSSIELSGEIKGERLRFVDAMKEATEIHVESTF
jgi:hypothetical protein